MPDFVSFSLLIWMSLHIKLCRAYRSRDPHIHTPTRPSPHIFEMAARVIKSVTQRHMDMSTIGPDHHQQNVGSMEQIANRRYLTRDLNAN